MSTGKAPHLRLQADSLIDLFRTAHRPTGQNSKFGALYGWGLNTTATRIEMQSINEDKGILDVPFK